jgi:glycosyltransferase involved in cell wall biosynthesis
VRVFISAGLFYPSKLGGPANTLYWLAKGFVTVGIDVSVVTSRKNIIEGLVESDKWTMIDNIRVRYCSTNSKLSIRVIWNSIKELRKCDIVLLSSFFYIPSILIAFFTSFTSKKLVWSPRGELYNNAIEASKVKQIYVKVIKLLFSERAIFHATSLDEEKNIKKFLGSNVKTFVIPNYMELPKKQNRVEIIEKYLLYVGRIAPIKALDNLLLGLAHSSLFMSSEYKLIIAGGIEKQFTDYYTDLLQILHDNRLLNDKVVFLGYVGGTEKFNLYANAYFSLLLSHSENFGNVVIESLTQGTPVITAKGTPWKQLVDNNSGFWINNDVQNISKCIDEVIQMEDGDYQQKRNNAYNLAMKYDIHRNIDKWTSIIK